MSKSTKIDPKHDNYYKRLGLIKTATTTEVKRAFFQAVKIYPPEKDPKNHKLIREAYDVLKNSISKNEYDTKEKLGTLLNKLETDLDKAEKAEDLDKQIIILKKIVNMAPDLGIYRNKLGNAFMEKEEFGKAKKQYEKALTHDSENTTYLLNMGHALKEEDNYNEAENYYIQAWDLDKEDYSAPRALAQLYFHELDNKTKAHSILDKAIDADGKVDFQDFFCIHDKLYFYCLAQNESGLKRELKRVVDIAKNEEEKEFAAFMIFRIGGQLYDVKSFTLANQFLKTATILRPENSDFEKFYNECFENSERIKSFEKIRDDDDIHQFAKQVIGLYLGRYYGEINDDEFNSEIKQLAEYANNIMDTDPDCYKIKDSFRNIRDNYNSVYKINSSFFNTLINFPEPTNYRAKCPYSSCRQYVSVKKTRSLADPMDVWRYSDPLQAKFEGGYGEYGCPHCNKTIKYGSSGYSTVSTFSSGSSSGSGCFIATAVYKDYNHPKVMVLRRFRDEILSSAKWGRKFIKVYYRFSPPIAVFLVKHKYLSKLTERFFLKPVITLIKKIQ